MIKKISIMHKDVRETLQLMSYESVGRLFMAVLAYANDEEYSDIIGNDDNARLYFPTLRNHVDRMEEVRTNRSHAGREGGKSGGAPIGNNNASKTKQIKANQSKTKQNKAPNHTLPNHTLPNPYIKDILSFLNEKTGRHFRESKETERLINGRINEGYTVEDFKVVITKKCKEWKNDPKMSTFLRPSTLFAPSHFDEYLNQTEAKEKIVECSKGFSMINRDESEIDFSALEKRLVKNY